MCLGKIGTAFVFLAASMISCESGKKEVENSTAKGSDVEMWVTTGDKSLLLQPMTGRIEEGTKDGAMSVKIDTSKTYQTMDGFGFSLTGGSAMLLSTKLSPENRSALLRELFTTDEVLPAASFE